ncbi:glycoside hydrolase family 43 protein [Melissococcus plutonius]|uniref:glycoside hydrolase family 43 protein n=1 Tax=Melissococcus plutonius TaxID=33970 RepID=UPI0021E5B56A|nr:glycoside hydrolase family 43 protein [Melissococcus plutonius]MCV2499127.1 glycoside hydrolase family 43 protein [Melissococcus plutonius]MCV2500313.1 glycoside hydrolase family 43 protein [Melissococcus plutonius]MCV2507632.1 glycoside hydrolase family 43 protein [Melissococcus plutonius]MCV2527250.1 glycoside hydrolase family 43 protein [Melissococcus plutonius]
MNKKKMNILLAFLLLITFSVVRTFEVQAADKKKQHTDTNRWVTTTKQRVSIHDPSTISVMENGKETFYIFGSHITEAKSTDLKNWQVPFNSEYENPENNLVLGNLKENLKESFAWAGYNDADSRGGYAIWAPDVIWNANYQWKNGDKGAYMYFYSASSTWRRSCIGFAVSKNVEGPYTYANTIVYSGFTEKDSTDGSDRNTNYQNTNLKKLISNGQVAGFNPKWSINNGHTYNTDYAPNAIDPGVFFDKDGKFWMTYGSWSGGIFILELNPTTGNPIYPKVDGDKGNGQIVDRYFGTKLTGGYHKSGEAPYIVYDPSTNYYYLFETYGGLLADGGYNMRLFRSTSPQCPYRDAKGNIPIFNSSSNNDNWGIKLMGNYQFNQMTKASKAQGHNSAIITKDKQWYAVYHTRLSNSGEYHELRVHSMYMNEDLWPVVTPYEFADKENKVGKTREIVGHYQFINHGTNTTNAITPTQNIYLSQDGKIMGSVSGSWQLKKNGNITLYINGVTYKGNAILQQDNQEHAPKKVVTFSAIGNNNETIWGSKIAN